jgi:hypothetical protein
MLLLPALPLDCQASVYADDTDIDVFYVVPHAPRIRIGENAGPALVFYKYRSVPPGESAATGGGFLLFQTELVLDAAERTAITRALRDRPGAGPGEPSLRAPTYVDGTVELITFSPVAGGLVEAIEGTTHPSLFDGLAAAFALKLSQDGAALLWTQLRSTPSPVAVRYSLTMLARLPPGRVHVWLHSGPLREGWAELAALDPGTARSQALASRGLAGVDVLDWPPAGSAGLDQLKEHLVRWGWDLLDQGADGAITGSGRSPDWDRVADVDTVLTGRSTITWPVRPGANLPAVSGGAFLEVDLSDPIFDVLRVEARCNADFTGNRIAAITLQLRYGEVRQDVLFTDNTTTSTFRAVIDPRLGRGYHYRTVIQFQQTSHTLELPEQAADGEQLLLSVGDVGWVRIDVIGTALDWSRTELVEVHLSYADPVRGIPAQDDVLMLRASRPQELYERAVWVPVDQPWTYRAVHVLRDGRRVELPPASRTGRVLVVPDPFTRFLTVRWQAPAGFSTVAAHLIECDHTSADGLTVRETFQLKSGTDEATWSVGLLPDEPAQFRYRIGTTFTDGHAQQHDWVPATGSQTIAVGSAPKSLLEVRVAADVLDYRVVKLAQVSLWHITPGGEEHRKNLLFQLDHHDPQLWTVPLAAGDPPSYSWSAQFYLTDGTRRSIPAADSTERVLVLHLPPA